VSLFASLPDDRRPAVVELLRKAFGNQPVVEGERLTGGSAVGVFRFSVAGDDYVLRVEGQGPMRDTRRHYACMAIAAEGGIAPPIVASDAEAGICIIRYITPKPAPWSGRLAEAALQVRRMHDLPVFPKAMPYRQAIGFMIGALKASPAMAEDIKPAILDLYQRLDAAYPWGEDTVSCHHDLNPANFIFDGERHWIVDWEMAFASDPFGDLATLCNWLTADAAQEDEVLLAYFGRAATGEERTRLAQMRQLSRLVFGSLLVMSSPPQDSPALTRDLWDASPSFNDLRGEMSAMSVYGGRLRFGTAFLTDAVNAG
jgi:hypothetical protein